MPSPNSVPWRKESALLSTQKPILWNRRQSTDFTDKSCPNHMYLLKRRNGGKIYMGLCEINGGIFHISSYSKHILKPLSCASQTYASWFLHRKNSPFEVCLWLFYIPIFDSKPMWHLRGIIYWKFMFVRTQNHQILSQGTQCAAE